MHGLWHSLRWAESEYAAAMPLPSVRLRKDLALHIAAGHPWVYADALAAPAAVPTGSVVDVLGVDGRFVGRGLWDAESPIAVRIYTHDVAEALDDALVARRLGSALSARTGAFGDNTDCFRWCNGEGDRLPGVVVDVYARTAVVRFDGEAARALKGGVVAALPSLRPLDHVYERSRGARGEVLWGTEPPRPVEVSEHGVRFGVDVHSGQKTGFFLDQRENRRLLAGFARGLEVVNLFGYTGGFSVHCALGGASKVTTVDVARQALVDAGANFRRNGLDDGAHDFVCEDAFAWMRRTADAGRRFGLVIVDPPSFAPSERTLKKALLAYRDLNVLGLELVPPGGLLASSSCSSHVDMEAFCSMLGAAAVAARRPIRLLELRGQPADHPSLPAFPEGRYLKFVLARVD